MFGRARSKHDVVPKKLAIVQLVCVPIGRSDRLQDAAAFCGYVPHEMIERKNYWRLPRDVPRATHKLRWIRFVPLRPSPTDFDSPLPKDSGTAPVRRAS